MCDEVASGELFLLRNIQEDPAAPGVISAL